MYCEGSCICVTGRR